MFGLRDILAIITAEFMIGPYLKRFVALKISINSSLDKAQIVKHPNNYENVNGIRH